MFQAGNYPQGNVTVEDLKGYVNNSKKALTPPVILGHVGDWIKNKFPRTAIPKAGNFINFSVEGNYLVGDIELNEFGKSIVGDGAYENMSIAFTESGKIDHLALLGYAEPACKYIDSLSKQDLAFSEDKDRTIKEYAITIIEEVEKMDFEALKLALKALTMTLDQKIELIEEVMGSITQSDKDKMKMALGYGSYQKMETIEDKKKVFETLKVEFTEQPKFKTEKEIRDEIQAEYDEKARQEKEFSELEKEIKAKVIPCEQEFALMLAKEAVKETKVLEFSKEDGTKESLRLADRMKAVYAGRKEFDGLKEWSAVKKDGKKKETIEDYKKEFEEMQK